MVKETKLKRSILSKVFLLFFSCVVLLFFVVLLIMGFALNLIAAQETYYRLNNYIALTSFEWRQGQQIRPLDEEIFDNLGIIQGTFDGHNFIIGPSEIPEDFALGDMSNFLTQVKLGDGVYVSPEGDTIYYSCAVDEQSSNFIIVLIDDTYNNEFIKRIVTRSILVVMTSLVLLSIIMVLWASRLSNRIKLLQDHITNMNKNKYEEAYLDPGNDELRELSESIEDMREEIKNSETTKREMLQNVSHDFKTPIAVIKNYAEAIVDGVISPEDAIIIVKQADILKSKVSQLLQYNRLEYLNKDNPFEKVDMKDVVNEVVNNHKVNNQNIEFVLNLESCIFEGYRENFVTVVENIVENALRYAKEKIVITTKENKVTIFNDGEPIEEKFINATFKPYEKGSKGEFGLGMSIVQKTLDFFELKLKIYNETTGGVSFVIYKDK